MKTKILISLFILLSGFTLRAQITKMESFSTGTKISFYPNECGNDIPEAEGKLSFCDRENSLGVVDISYGLNNRQVLMMGSNYYNEDEIYVTNSGISIRNADSTWENIPNIAIPLWGTTYLPTIKAALLLPDGRLLIHAINAGYLLNTYDRTSKTFTAIDFPDYKYPQRFVYDTERNLTWIIANSGGISYLFSFDGTTLSEIANLGSIGISYSNPISCSNDSIWVGNNFGLYKIDISDYTSSVSVEQYNSTSTPSIPFDTVLDIKSDTGGNIWLANFDINDGAIVKFDTTTETYDIYQAPDPDYPTSNIRFSKLALDDNAEQIWAVSNTYFALIALTFEAGTPSWDFLSGADLTDLGVPIIYIPNHIYFENDKFYFTTSSGSSGGNSAFEVLINNDGSWSGRNDNEPGNLSYNMTQRFQNSLPDNTGGVWWFNNFDNVIVHRDNNDNHQAISLTNFNSYNQAVDLDNKAIVKGGSPSEIRKIDFPDAVSIESVSNTGTDIKRFENQIWIYDNNIPKIDIYENDVLVNTWELSDSDYYYFPRMAIDDDGNSWFIKGSGALQIRKFDPSTMTTTTYDRDENFGNLKNIIAAPNNGIWIVGYYGLMYIEDGNFYPFFTSDYPELNHLEDAVVDTNGKLYILNNTTLAITTLENPTTTPTLNRIELEYNSILPSLELNGGSTITIDSEGSVWTHSNLKSIKLVDSDLTIEYIQENSIDTQNQKVSSGIQVYPNPTTGYVSLNTDLSIDYIDVYSILGEKIIGVSDSKSIDLSNLKSGMYILKITSKNKTLTKKIMLK